MKNQKTTIALIKDAIRIKLYFNEVSHFLIALGSDNQNTIEDDYMGILNIVSLMNVSDDTKLFEKLVEIFEENYYNSTPIDELSQDIYLDMVNEIHQHSLKVA